MTLEQLNPQQYILSTTEKVALSELLPRLRHVERAWLAADIKHVPFLITSGVRSPDYQVQIYRAKAKAAKLPFDVTKVPMGSKHISGHAADVADPGLKITTWLKANSQVLTDAQLWCEDGNTNWVHFQSQPFGSFKQGGTRWFKP